jgi:hypothetical protein
MVKRKDLDSSIGSSSIEVLILFNKGTINNDVSTLFRTQS